MEKYSCSCCQPPRCYSEKRNLRKHQRVYDQCFVEGGENSAAFKTEKRRRYELDPAICLECKTPFSYELYYENSRRKFCSRQCNGAHSAKNRIRRGRVRSVFRYCLECGQLNGKNANSYCGKTCEIAHKKNAMIEGWLSGTISGSDVSGNLRSPFRIYMLEQANYSCSECGWNKIHPKTGRVPVQVDHIDGHSSNNVLSNLRVLCPNCHSLTSTYGSLNNGNGRRSRRERRDRISELDLATGTVVRD